MKNAIASIVAVIMIVGTAIFGFTMMTASASQNKVGVCHRTASDTNPYTYIEVPEHEANGHITGTDKQHNEKAVWKSDGVWRGVVYAAGDIKLDYLATNRLSCENTTVTEPTDNPTEDVSETPTPTVTVEPSPTETITEDVDECVVDSVDTCLENPPYTTSRVEFTRDYNCGDDFVTVTKTTITTGYVWSEVKNEYVASRPSIVTQTFTESTDVVACETAPIPPRALPDTGA